MLCYPFVYAVILRVPLDPAGAGPQQGIDLDYCDIEWITLEMNRDHSVIFEIASKYGISDSLVDHEGYSISSKGFPTTVVDIMVI